MQIKCCIHCRKCSVESEKFSDKQKQKNDRAEHCEKHSEREEQNWSKNFVYQKSCVGKIKLNQCELFDCPGTPQI